MTNIQKGITLGIFWMGLQLIVGCFLESSSPASAEEMPPRSAIVNSTSLAPTTFLAPASKIAQLGGSVNHSQLVTLIAEQMVSRVNQMSCNDFRGSLYRLQNAQKGQNNAVRARLFGALQANPELRRTFIDAIAAPLANKMFDCGLIPPP